MANNIQRTKGRGSNYKFDRGGMPTEMGPFIGEVKNNIDPTRSGRLQVYIEQFAGDNPDNKSLWRTVSYVPPFYGTTPFAGTTAGVGSFKGNQQSYGMWFTPPDIGTNVICFFVAGDPSQGFYIGCVPEETINHMVPAIGASSKYQVDSEKMSPYFEGVTQLPVTEINNENLATIENPRFFDQTKPVHSVLAGIMLQQGLIKDVLRGPITSSSQRESPSSVYGISTPGRAIYQAGLNEENIKQKLDAGDVKLTDIKVTGRRGGHSIIMDDGDLRGYDNLIRIRTSKGHQISMSDDGDCFYLIHANGQTWIEMGSEGTVDIFSTNSVNVRTQGEINLHADKSINMYAGENINMKSKNMKMQATDKMELLATNQLNVYSNNSISVLSDGTIALKSGSASGWTADYLALKAGKIDLNGPSPTQPEKATPLEDVLLPDTKFKANVGWESTPETLTTIVSRAPTHEPYPYHNRGVAANTSLSDEAPAETESLPASVSITRSS
jgi:hypothetical protein